MNKPSMNQGSWSRGLVLLILGVPCAVALCVSGCGSSSSAGGEAGAAAAASADAGASGDANSSAAGAAGVVDTAGAGGSAGEGGALDERGMFGALGVDITTSPRTYQDSNGKVHPLGDDYNPLGRGVKSLQPQAEVYLAGLSFADSTANQFLLDSAGVNPAKKALPITDGADTWAGNRYVKSLAIDVDGDGVDEIANVYYVEASHELHANLIRCTAGCDGDGGKFTNVKDSVLAVQDSTLVPTERHWFSHGLLAADVDGDGKQELVVANFGGIDVCVPNKKFEFACTARVKDRLEIWEPRRFQLGVGRP